MKKVTNVAQLTSLLVTAGGVNLRVHGNTQESVLFDQTFEDYDAFELFLENTSFGRNAQKFEVTTFFVTKDGTTGIVTKASY